MQYSKIIIAALSLALAEAKISFTTLPNAVEAGEAVQLKWTGGNDGPVTITLKKGDANDLQTVDVLTGNAQGNSYTWTPSSDLSDGDDYALQISQGVDEVNYTGQFSLSGGSDNDDDEDSSSSSGYPTSSVASASASTTVETTVTSANSTSSRSHTVYVTGTAPMVPSASGTGINVTRNTTFSSATPTRSQSGGLIASTTGAATTTSDSEDSAATTSGSAEPSSGAASHMEIQIGAGIAAMVGLVALL